MAEPETDDVVERAVRSLLDQVPTAPDLSVPVTALQQRQPWADIAAPSGTDKKSLEQLVEEFEAKVAADPSATIGPNPLPSRSEAYLERFSRPAQRPGKRRRRRKRGGSSAGVASEGNGSSRQPRQRTGGARAGGQRSEGARGEGQSRPAAPRPEGPRPEGAAGAPRRRRRRRGGRGRGGAGPQGGNGTPA